MKNPDLTHEEACKMLSYDAADGVLRWKQKPVGKMGRAKEGAPVGHTGKDGYVRATVKGQAVLVHRLVWFVVNGRWPEQFIDHINRNPSDNRLCNLQELDNASNLQRQYAPQRNSTTGYRGVTYNKTKKKFQATIKVNGKLLNLGRFTTPEEAYEAYLFAKQQYHHG